MLLADRIVEPLLQLGQPPATQLQYKQVHHTYIQSHITSSCMTGQNRESAVSARCRSTVESKEQKNREVGKVDLESFPGGRRTLTIPQSSLIASELSSVGNFGLQTADLQMSNFMRK